MREISSMGHTTSHARARAAAVSDDQHALMRGVVHGVVLSMFDRKTQASLEVATGAVEAARASTSASLAIVTSPGNVVSTRLM